MKQVASLRYGVIFKKAFSDIEVFTAFVKDFAGVELDIDRVETEKSFFPPIGRVDSRFDLFAEDKRHRVVVDIQHVKFPDHYDRFLYYHCVALLEQVAHAENYTPPVTVITLVVLTSGGRQKYPVSVIDFDPKELWTGTPLGVIHHKVFYLCPKYVTQDTPEPYRQWLMAIQDSLDEEVDESLYTHPALLKVFDLIEKDGVSPQEKAQMKDEYGYEQIGQEKFVEGKLEGLAEGQAKGERDSQLAMVRRLFAQGQLDRSTIAQVTGLSEAEIEALQQETL